jgi:phosphomannomutase
MSELDPSLVARAKDWIAGDPDATTARELETLIEEGAAQELRERMENPLTFGTAGLRGIVAAGPARMNRAVVVRTTRALVEHLLAHEPDARTLPVVVGYDARLSSRDFADAAVGVLAAARIPVRYFRVAAPTPLVAYAVRAVAASAGIIITASHNPGEYNGYKLYGRNGVQVIPPADADVERRLESVGPARGIPCVAPGSQEWSALVSEVPESITDRYLSDIDAARPRGPADRGFRIVYTPLHGVGGALVQRALEGAGFGVAVVPEQAEPDGHFPTVRFPNPEEKGAMDLAIELARNTKAELILANDPDADRLAVGVPTAAGRFVTLSGNQVGMLLADFLLSRAPTSPTPLVLSSIVSSPMLAALARSYGARYEVTLTGFKWIWSAALHLEATENVRFAFGFEEAIGFCACREVRDKDGIGAALVFAELAAQCRARGESVLERLSSLYVRHGLWVSVQHSIVRSGLEGAAEIVAAVDRLSASPPTSLGGMAVRDVTDFRRGAETRPFWLARSPLVVLTLDEGRVLLRPSGTEPKLKVYVDLRGAVASSGDVETVADALRTKAASLAAALASILGFA